MSNFDLKKYLAEGKLNEFKYGSLGPDDSLPNKKEREIGGNDKKKKYITSALDSIPLEDLQKVYVLVVNADKRGTDGITYGGK